MNIDDILARLTEYMGFKISLLERKDGAIYVKGEGHKGCLFFSDQITEGALAAIMPVMKADFVALENPSTKKANAAKAAEPPLIEAIADELIEAAYPGHDMRDIAIKLGEECGEVQGAITKKREGRATDEDLDDEVGDVLVVLSRIALRRGKTLDSLLRQRIRKLAFRFVELRDGEPSAQTFKDLKRLK